MTIRIFTIYTTTAIALIVMVIFLSGAKFYLGFGLRGLLISAENGSLPMSKFLNDISVFNFSARRVLFAEDGITAKYNAELINRIIEKNPGFDVRGAVQRAPGGSYFLLQADWVSGLANDNPPPISATYSYTEQSLRFPVHQ
jgi:hypothetical protein